MAAAASSNQQLQNAAADKKGPALSQPQTQRHAAHSRQRGTGPRGVRKWSCSELCIGHLEQHVLQATPKLRAQPTTNTNMYERTTVVHKHTGSAILSAGLNMYECTTVGDKCAGSAILSPGLSMNHSAAQLIHFHQSHLDHGHQSILRLTLQLACAEHLTRRGCPCVQLVLPSRKLRGILLLDLQQLLATF